MTEAPKASTLAWRMGFKAGRRRGKRKPTNPFVPGSREAIAWLYGFLAGRAKPLALVK
jgi:hypothetical protein